MSYQAPAKYNPSLQLWQEEKEITTFWPNVQSEQKRNKQMKELYQKINELEKYLKR